MAALNRTDAEDRARTWVAGAAPGAEPVLHEFSLGWVISARFPPSTPSPTPSGVPSVVLDRQSGELVVGGTLPPAHIAEWYSRGFQPPVSRLETPPGPRPYPATMTQLTIADRTWVARSRRSDAGRPLHPVVSTFFDAMPTQYRERGCERSSEAMVLSELFHAEEGARAEAGRPALDLADAQECVRGARLRTYEIREDADPAAGTPHRSTLPVLLLLDYLGLSPDAAASGR
jgi:hypothetical protein